MPGDAIAKLTPLRYESAPLRNQIIASLRSAIETGVLQPGARLIERDLCEQLNVSRTSLREALRELQALGVLASVDNRGLVVGMLTHEEAGNVYSIRAVLEALVVGQFVELASDEEVDQLSGFGQTLKKAYASGSVERIIKAKPRLLRLYLHRCAERHGVRHHQRSDAANIQSTQSLARPPRTPGAKRQGDRRDPGGDRGAQRRGRQECGGSRMWAMPPSRRWATITQRRWQASSRCAAARPRACDPMQSKPMS